MSSFARKVNREKLKTALKKRKEQHKRMHPGKKFVDVKFNKLWGKYREKMHETKWFFLKGILHIVVFLLKNVKIITFSIDLQLFL